MKTRVGRAAASRSSCFNSDVSLRTTHGGCQSAKCGAREARSLSVKHRCAVMFARHHRVIFYTCHSIRTDTGGCSYVGYKTGHYRTPNNQSLALRLIR